MTERPPGPYFYPKRGDVCVLTWVATGHYHQVGYVYAAVYDAKPGDEEVWGSLARLATAEEEAAWRLARTPERVDSE